MESESQRPLVLTLDFSRTSKASDPYDFSFSPNEYQLHREGEIECSSLAWDQKLLTQLAALHQTEGSSAALQEVGELLRRFMTPLGWQALAKEVQAAAMPTTEPEPGQPQEKGTVRVCLTIRSAAAELYALPWELLTLKGTKQHIGELAGVLLRYQFPGNQTAPQQQAPRSGGRILFAWSEAGGGVPASAHLSAITTACIAGAYPFDADRDVLASASPAALEAALAEAKQKNRPISVLHILCHGGPVGDKGSSFGLIFDKDEGAPQASSGRMDGGRLRRLLGDYRSMVRLVVLMACNSGHEGALGNALGSVAQALHAIGIEAVVASRFPLSAAGSITLTRALYSRLLIELDSLEESVLFARGELIAHHSAELDWASVQLYARGEDGLDTRPVVFQPYRGLSPFLPEHHRFLFGRDTEIQEIISDLQSLVEQGRPRLLVVAGASGTGKSSLVLAGVLPRLRKVHKGLEFRLMRPGSDPMSALQRALTSLPANVPILLVVDQFEELFTQKADANKDDMKAREAFARELWRLAVSNQTDLRIIVTMRIDFLGRCGDLILDEASGQRFDRVAIDPAHQILVPQMNKAQLRAVIVEPAHQVGLLLQPGLVNRMIDDVGGEPGALPLLEYALDVLWQQRSGRFLTQDAYEQLGDKSTDRPGDKRSGVVGALRQRADELLNKFSEDERALARRLFLNLVAVADDSALDTRRRVELQALRCLFSDAEAAGFERVLQALVDARFLVQSDGEDGRAAQVEVAHEALIRAWPQLKGWIAENRSALLAQRRLLLAAEHWNQHGRDPALLYRGSQLSPDSEWRKGWQLGTLGREFIQASEAQRSREEHDKANQLRRTRLTAAVLSVLLMISAGAGVQVYRKSVEVSQLLLDTYMERGYQLLFVEEKPDEAVLWLHRAYKAGSKNPILPQLLKSAMQPLDARQAVLVGHTSIVNTARFSPDGQRIVTAGNDGKAWIFDAKSGQKIAALEGHSDIINSATYSPDGHRIVTACADGMARIFDANTGQLLVLLKGHAESVNSARFNPDGNRVVTASWDKLAAIFDTQSGRLLARLEGHTSIVNTASYSRDGLRIVTAGADSTARVFDAHDGHLLVQLEGHQSEINEVAFSPDGRRIVTAGTDHRAGVFDAETGRSLLWLRGHTDELKSAAFSPDGRRIVTASDDLTARVFDTETGNELIRLKGHAKPIRSAVFSPDGRRIATACFDGKVRIFDSVRGNLLALLVGHKDEIYSALFSPNGLHIVTAGSDQTARVFSIQGSRSLMELQGDGTRLLKASYSPDGRRIMTEDLATTARVFDAASGHRIAQLPRRWGAARKTRYSPDYRYVAVIPADARPMQLFDAESGRQLAELEGEPSTDRQTLFSADSSSLITTSANKAYVFDLRNAKHRAELSGHERPIRIAAFSPDGRRIFTISAGGSIRIFDAASGQSLVSSSIDKDYVVDASYSPDSRYLITVGTAGMTRLFDADSLHQHSEFKLSEEPARSVVYSPDGRSILIISDDGVARILDAQIRHILVELKDSKSHIRAASYSRDGRYIVTISGGQARIWDAASGRNLAELIDVPGEVQDASFSPDGRQVVTASSDGTAQIWDASPETRSNDALDQLIRCRALARFETEAGNVIVPTIPNPSTCPAYPIPGPR